MAEQQIRERVRTELSARRFVHTQGVVDTAVELAQRFGGDIEKARMAAWIHDLAREWSADKLQQFAERIEIPSGFALIPALLHGPIAASLAPEWFDVHDEDVLNAVRFHTTGRVGMSKLEMIICLADAIEPGRNYPEVDRIRQIAQTDLQFALAESFDSTIRYLIETQQSIFPLTVMARNEFWDQVHQVQNREEIE
ncbi:MAG: metal-dependent phosphohydrolase [Alicyclobacillus sp. RIFOXYA1_FULL_53_8]|nr:MAG: metal-dependent phosphohydrolase [Alicyclobacillus sp. RIFOXYA1_FULL_53_8]